MGVFSYYLGKPDIPEEDRAEYGRQALAMLRAGGMMSVDRVHLYGKELCLLFPPELNDKGEASSNYNYLDNESWESWWLSAASGAFGSGKIGGNCFYETVLAGEEAPEAVFFQLLQQNLKEYHQRGGELKRQKSVW